MADAVLSSLAIPFLVVAVLALALAGWLAFVVARLAHAHSKTLSELISAAHASRPLVRPPGSVMYTGTRGESRTKGASGASSSSREPSEPAAATIIRVAAKASPALTASARDGPLDWEIDWRLLRLHECIGKGNFG